MTPRPLPAIFRTPLARVAFGRTVLTRGIIDRFVAGPTAADAVAAVAALADLRLLATIDLLGEGATRAEDAASTVLAYLRLVDLADRAGIAAGLDVSVKLSALGQAVPRDGRKLSYDNAAEICARAAAVNATVTVDMEDHTTTDATLDTLVELRRDFPSVGAVLQAQLLRTPADCHDLATAGSRVRLCKGAYREPSSVAHRGRPAVTAAYGRCLGILFAATGYPMVATHDPQLLALAPRLAEHLGRRPDEYEYQMLFGVRPDEQARLAATGATVRVYVPYGADCVPYLVRRLVEKPSNLLLAAHALRSRR